MDELGSKTRLKLHEILVDLMAPNKVYFQPPASLKLTYPCIIYQLDQIQTDYANSKKYKNKKAYSITIIDSNPDSEILIKILELEYSNFNRFFISDNLNHYVFTLYY